jgi:polyhydroxyalkanoate synthase
MTRPHQGKYVDPDAYLAQATPKEGSWWPEWCNWLGERSGPLAPIDAHVASHASLGEAPGTYVRQS